MNMIVNVLKWNMTLESKIANLYRMDEKARRRHANPWSGYSRFSMIPLIGLTFWSRVWLGWWAFGPIIIVLLWAWFNPRIFPEPKSTNNWASKGVCGEWVWMNRKEVPVPKHHLLMPNILSAINAIGAIPFIWGLVVLEIWLTVLGGIVMAISKIWFVDRMVWLYEDTKNATPEYKKLVILISKMSRVRNYAVASQLCPLGHMTAIIWLCFTPFEHSISTCTSYVHDRYLKSPVAREGDCYG